ncbi:hypothetical protein IDF66_11110 [Gordonia hankookensis]|uniref:Transposase n=1 Tax=Gordonia hankookensis TaxID=589403 RepID=A0ABR7WBF5_9ACTN|nr:hypothetical protein [Gordonia hankookensis]
MLSGLSPSAVRDALGERLESFTPSTITRFDELDAQPSRARDCGWSSVREDPRCCGRPQAIVTVGSVT